MSLSENHESTSTPSPRSVPSPAAMARNISKSSSQNSTSSEVVVTKTPLRQPSVADAQKYGHIDSDGAVWLNTSVGQRRIGEWKAGTEEEGFLHFSQRYVDLATTIDLLEVRLAAHPEDAVQVRASVEKMRSELPDASILGDIDALYHQLSAIEKDSFAAESAVKNAREQRRRDAHEAKEKLVAEAESLGKNSTDWKETGDRLSAILDEWKAIKGLDRATDDELWQRFSKARGEFNRRRGTHFADLDRKRADSKRKKEDLVEQAEALQNSTEWNDTAKAFKNLMDQWRQAGRAPREIDDQLWLRFKKAQDTFFDARHADRRRKDEEFAANAADKQALLDEYTDKILPEEHGVEQARRSLRELQEKWEAIGYVPRDQIRFFEDKISALEKRVQEAADGEWRRSDPEAQARIQQFRDKAAQLNNDADTAAQAGKDKEAASLREQAAQWESWADTAAAALNE